MLEMGGHPVYTAIGAAAALYKHAPEGDARAEFCALTGLEGGEYVDNALFFYDMLKNGASLTDVIAEADKKLTALYPTIV